MYMCFMFLTYLSAIVIKRCLQFCTVKTDIHRSMYIGNMLLNDTYNQDCVLLHIQ